MSTKRWLFVTQYGGISLKLLKPVQRPQGQCWRDELGCEYPARMVREHLTDAERQIFVHNYNDRARNMHDVHMQFHPEDTHDFVPLTYEQIIAKITAE